MFFTSEQKFKEASFLDISSFTHELKQIIFFIRQGKNKGQMLSASERNKSLCEDFPYMLIWKNISEHLDEYLNFLLQKEFITLS